MIGIVQLEQIIKRDVSDDNAYPFMIIANAGQFRILYNLR